MSNKAVNQGWFKAVFLSAISFYLYGFMEWIFFATKPSFMSSMNFSQKLTVFLISAFMLVVPGIFLGAFFGILMKRYKFLTWFAAAIPAFVIAVLSLIMLDNFTYTMFKFGIGTSEGVWRGVYAIIFLILFVFFLYKVVGFINKNESGRLNISHIAILLSLLASIITIAATLPLINFSPQRAIDTHQLSADLPNIILLGIDGVNADNMSVYGYERDTTPNLVQLSKNALFVENAISNGANTGGSVISILTGKLPTDTRVIYPPDILMGNSAYQHLPGILKQLGYYSVQISDSSFSDAYSRNIRDGFDIANSRSASNEILPDLLGRFGAGGSFYFYALMIQRASDRLEHIFYLRTMDNPYKLVTNPVTELTVQDQYNAMISILENTERPLFLHIHMLGTHGPQFSPSENIFSAGEIQDKSWMVDFYDDAIHDADKYVKLLFNYLNTTGKINNTIIVLYSDHGMNWNPRNRVPLIFWFPGKQYAGKIKENVQLIDIAPTILDYLDVSKPEWMHGQSILRDNISPYRPIYSAEQAADLVVHNEKGWVIDENKVAPPFYQLGKINLVICNLWFSLNMRTPELKYGEIDGSTADCEQAKIPTPQQAKDLIIQLLSNEGYDTTSYPVEIPYTSTLDK